MPGFVERCILIGALYLVGSLHMWRAVISIVVVATVLATGQIAGDEDQISHLYGWECFL